MPDPRLALLVFAIGAALTLAVVWPRRGLYSRLRRLRRRSERERVEDTLKYLFHRGEQGSDVHADALAGALQVGQSSARDLLERLAVGGLAEKAGLTHHRLTDAGRTEALRIVRSHRLLEHYLADRTGIGPEEWHELAEEREHQLSAAEVEGLAAQLGQPRYDPHGDPIPTASGELPASDAVLLPALLNGEASTITHLEDEPAEAFQQLVALGFALDKTLVVRDRSATVSTVELDGRALELPRALELAVSVLRTTDADTAPRRTLADLSTGEIARVRRLTSSCRGAQRRRLLDLGVVPGTTIEAELHSVSGDPIAYRIRGALIALRRQQAEWIEIESARDRTEDRAPDRAQDRDRESAA